MSNITVISKTQRIIVDPASSSVAVISAGPVGIAGPTGEVSIAYLNTELADLSTNFNTELTDLSNDFNTELTDLSNDFNTALTAKVDKYSGAGSPLGAVAAPVGSEYIDTAVTNGALKWIKQTGTGNSGWVVRFGDTGWRKVLSWTSGTQDGSNQIGILNSAAISIAGTGAVLTRRIQNVVYFAMPNGTANSLSLTVTGPANFMTAANWPAGFRASTQYKSAALSRAAAASPDIIDFANSISHPRIGTSSAPSVLLQATAQWPTDDAWPTGSLPGVAG